MLAPKLKPTINIDVLCFIRSGGVGILTRCAQAGVPGFLKLLWFVCRYACIHPRGH